MWEKQVFENMKLTDESKMPYGKHKDTEMADVPADYLIWLFENNRCSGNVKEYIKENLDVLQVEIKRNQK